MTTRVRKRLSLNLLDFENHMVVKKANVDKNRFSVIYTERAIEKVSGISSSMAKPVEAV